MSLQGSCLCRAVTYQIDGELKVVRCCHCSACRKVSGTAFATGAPIDASQFHLLTGNDAIKEFESSPGVFRTFCGTCSSPLYTRRTAHPDTLILRVGLLDTRISIKPSMHIFVSDKAEWYDICDGMPQFETVPE